MLRRWFSKFSPTRCFSTTAASVGTPTSNGSRSALVFDPHVGRVSRCETPDDTNLIHEQRDLFALAISIDAETECIGSRAFDEVRAGHIQQQIERHVVEFSRAIRVGHDVETLLTVCVILRQWGLGSALSQKKLTSRWIDLVSGGIVSQSGRMMSDGNIASFVTSYYNLLRTESALKLSRAVVVAADMLCAVIDSKKDDVVHEFLSTNLGHIFRAIGTTVTGELDMRETYAKILSSVGRAALRSTTPLCSDDAFVTAKLPNWMGAYKSAVARDEELFDKVFLPLCEMERNSYGELCNLLNFTFVCEARCLVPSLRKILTMHSLQREWPSRENVTDIFLHACKLSELLACDTIMRSLLRITLPSLTPRLEEEKMYSDPL